MFQSQRSVRRLLLVTTALTIIATSARTARADLALTAAGVSEGLSLTKSSSGYTDSNGNGTGVGPISVGFTSSGGMAVSYYNDNALVFYPTTASGQTVEANGTIVPGYPNVTGMVTAGHNIYVAEQGAGSIVKLNGDGTFNSTLATGLGPATGMAFNPVNGRIYVSNLSGTVFSVNLTTGVATPFITATGTNYAPDGLSVSPDGSTLYAEINQHILGFSTTTGKQVFDSGKITLADGAADATGSLAGNLFVNTNAGNVYQVNEATLAQTLVASGGSRGDLVTVDPSNGALMLSQSNSIDQLTLPFGSTFASVAPGSTVAAVPEPASLALLGGAMCAVGMLRRRKH